MYRSYRASILGLAAAFGAVISTQSDDASACGGLFCNAALPVNQAAERIIFATNDDGTVTAAIEVQYEGPAESFAWVLPVPAGEIAVGVSSKLALDRLDNQTNPIYRLNVIFDPECPVPNAAGGGGFGSAPSAESGVDSADDPSVQVVQEGNAGPYDYQVIAVNPDLDDPAEVAVEWLTENDYDLGELGPDVLRPYLESGLNLVAFRLTKGSDSGSIRPIMLTYRSEQPFIPIRPTAVAANDDMGVKVWVLGSARAIPENYLHLELNESLINWFNPNSNYNDVIIAAADEAGGQGFVTEQAGPASEFSEIIYTAGDAALWNELRTGQFSSIEAFITSAVSYFGSYDGFLDVLRNVVPLRDGTTPEQLVACTRCYFAVDVPVRNEAYPPTEFDPDADPILDLDVSVFLEEMDELVIGPLEDTSALFEKNSNVTRMYTTLSPEEMTVDPSFTFNPELEDVSNVHVADQTMMCATDGPGWRIDLPQGMTVEGDGQTWPLGLDSGMPANLRILQLSTSGGGIAIEDNAAVIGAMLADLGVGEAKPELMNPPGPAPSMPDDVAPDDMDPEVQPPNPDDPPSTPPSDMQDDDDEPRDDDSPARPAPEDDGNAPDDESDEDAPEDGSLTESDDDPVVGEGDSDDGGCGCATVGAPSSDEGGSTQRGSWAWLAALGLAALRRRRH